MNPTTKTVVAALLVLCAVAAANWQPFPFPGAPKGIANPALFEGNGITALACSSDGKTLYVGQDALLWKSTDGGETWKVLRK